MTPKDDNENGDWAEYRRLVLSELERLNLIVDNQKLEIDKLKLGATERNAKVAVISTIAGMIPAIISILCTILWGK